jgi:cytochrome P450
MNEHAVLKLVAYLDKKGADMLDKIDNTTYTDVLKLRMEAAENGIEMTPDEVLDLILLLKEAGS